ncbi:MAG: hypothetical protein R6V85_14375 [Polyangia bacterium]
MSRNEKTRTSQALDWLLIPTKCSLWTRKAEKWSILRPLSAQGADFTVFSGVLRRKQTIVEPEERFFPGGRPFCWRSFIDEYNLHKIRFGQTIFARQLSVSVFESASASASAPA